MYSAADRLCDRAVTNEPGALVSVAGRRMTGRHEALDRADPFEAPCLAGPGALRAHPTNGDLWVAVACPGPGDAEGSLARVSAATGALTHHFDRKEGAAASVCFSPDGRAGYVLHRGLEKREILIVQKFDVLDDGSPGELAAYPLRIDDTYHHDWYDICMHPSGGAIYAAEGNPGGVCAIDPGTRSGAETPYVLRCAPESPLLRAVCVAATPDGRALYAAFTALWRLEIDPAAPCAPALAVRQVAMPRADPPVPARCFGAAVAVCLDAGGVVYVADHDCRRIWRYTVADNSDEAEVLALRHVDVEAVKACANPCGVHVTPAGRLLVAQEGCLYACAADAPAR